VAEEIDDITIEYEEDGKLLVKELKKEVLTRGSWTTIMFMYQEMDRKTGEYNPEKVSIRRFQKSRGQFRMKSKFNISNEKQARQIIATLEKWFDGGDEQPAEEATS
jgi:hypothetical protein